MCRGVRPSLSHSNEFSPASRTLEIGLDTAKPYGLYVVYRYESRGGLGNLNKFELEQLRIWVVFLNDDVLESTKFLTYAKLRIFKIIISNI